MAIRIFPYLIFDDSLEAISYYEDVFGARLIFRKGATPEAAAHFQLPAGKKPEEITLHGALLIAGNMINFADSFVFKKPENAAFLLSVQRDNAEDLSALEALYERVSASPTVKVLRSYQETDFGGKEGFIRDKYGIRWHFVAEPDLDFLKNKN